MHTSVSDTYGKHLKTVSSSENTVCAQIFCLQQTIKAMRPGYGQFLFWLVQNKNELWAQNITSSRVDILSRLHLNSTLHKHAPRSAKEAL